MCCEFRVERRKVEQLSRFDFHLYSANFPLSAVVKNKSALIGGYPYSFHYKRKIFPASLYKGKIPPVPALQMENPPCPPFTKWGTIRAYMKLQSLDVYYTAVNGWWEWLSATINHVFVDFNREYVVTPLKNSGMQAKTAPTIKNNRCN